MIPCPSLQAIRREAINGVPAARMLHEAILLVALHAKITTEQAYQQVVANTHYEGVR